MDDRQNITTLKPLQDSKSLPNAGQGDELAAARQQILVVQQQREQAFLGAYRALCEQYQCDMVPHFNATPQGINMRILATARG